MEELNKNPKKVYTRVCRRCQELFRTASKSSKICVNCDKGPKKINRNKIMLRG